MSILTFNTEASAQTKDANKSEVSHITNPFKNKLSLTLNIKTPESVSIELYDIVGVFTMQLIQPKVFLPNNYEENFDLSALRPGIYFLVYNIGKDRSVKKIIKSL